MRKQGVILDVDGTLVDSNEGQIRAWQEALDHFGIETTLDDVRRLVGMGGDQLLPSIAGLERESELGARISEIKKAIFEERYQDEVRPWPGAVELLGRLHAQGMRLVVASSCARETAEALLRLADPHRLVREIVSSSDVESTKPAPDLVRSALARLGMPAAAAVLLGDTPYDLVAAHRVGVDLVAFRCGGWRDDDLRGALEIWGDPEDLLDHFEGSVLGGARGGSRRAA